MRTQVLWKADTLYLKDAECSFRFTLDFCIVDLSVKNTNVNCYKYFSIFLYLMALSVKEGTLV